MAGTAEARRMRRTVLRRVLTGTGVLVVLMLMVVLPPLIHIGRYQRRVTAAMSGALGRPVHFDNITFHLLPLPGLTIENFVVSENPKFGAEPVLRANTVEARLRIWSLWRRRVEISKISLQSASVNLVHNPDGEWNLGGILTQASRFESAPTAQRVAGDAPRFPYIEATDARMNVKLGQDKLPFSVTGATFALWLPAPNEWHVRIAGKPVRTDTDVSDVGELRLEGTLGRAVDLASAPVDLHVDWKPTPLGEMSKIMMADDMGWRGSVSGSMDIQGTLGAAKLATDMHLRDVRRADFVPAKALQVDAHCEAAAQGMLHSLHEVRCAVPTEEKVSVLTAFLSTRGADKASPDAGGVLTMSAEVPTTMDWRTAEMHVERKGKPEYWLDWLRLFSRRIPAGLSVDGSSEMQVVHQMVKDRSAWAFSAVCRCTPTDVPEVTEAAPAKEKTEWLVTATHDGFATQAVPGAAVMAYPTTDEDATLMVQRIPADPRIEGVVERGGYSLRYSSAEAAGLASRMFPPLGDGIPAGASRPLQAKRSWGTGQPQIWTAIVPTERRRRR